MSYATPSVLLDQFASDEIAQRADRSIPRLVSAEMLKAAATGGDMSGYTVDEQAATATALALIEQKLLDADSVIDGYLISRYETPLAVVPRLIVGVACNLARYALYDDIATEQITQRYKDAVKLLEAINAGKINLGKNDSQVAPQDHGSVKCAAPDRVFNASSLEGF
jgi:phage gp36-like protein